MALNLILAAITLLMAGFLLVWCCLPRLRPWIEAPKYRVLQWERREQEGPAPPGVPGADFSTPGDIRESPC
jgi:hypothetical protein